MAKKKIIIDTPFARTEPAPQPTPEAPGKTTPLGVVLTAAEQARLQEIADALGMSRHKLLQYAVRDWLQRFEAGEIPTETRPALRRLK